MAGPSYAAGSSLTTGSNNTYLGRRAGHTNSTGSNNVAIGRSAMEDATNTTKNVCIGNTAGKTSICNCDLSTNQQINSITFNKEVLPRYGLYYMNVFGRDLLKWMNFVTIPIISKGELSHQQIIIPPIEEQTNNIEIEINYLARNDNEVEFYVKDYGVGIPEESVDRLTERFYRIDKGRSREHGGTGLGLSIVKHIMNRHDGKLEIESAINEGSKFTCVFPKT